MSNKPPNGTPSQAELQQLRKWLRDNGMSNQDAQNLVKNRTRHENTVALRDWLRQRPKAGNR